MVIIQDNSDALAPLDLEARALDVALRNAFKLSQRWLAAPPVEMKSLVREIVEQITVAADRIEIRLSRAKMAAALEAEGASQRPTLPALREAHPDFAFIAPLRWAKGK